jgi:hypothetical protein
MPKLKASNEEDMKDFNLMGPTIQVESHRKRRRRRRQRHKGQPDRQNDQSDQHKVQPDQRNVQPVRHNFQPDRHPDQTHWHADQPLQGLPLMPLADVLSLANRTKLNATIVSTLVSLVQLKYLSSTGPLAADCWEFWKRWLAAPPGRVESGPDGVERFVEDDDLAHGRCDAVWGDGKGEAACAWDPLK